MQKTIQEKWEEGGITFLPHNSIVKLVYKREYFDIEALRVGCREVITIKNDGTIEMKAYRAGSRTAWFTQNTHCSPAAFAALCNKLEYCIQHADRLDTYVDDTSMELKMFHQFDRVQIVDRGLGNAESNIGSIMNDFFEEQRVAHTQEMQNDETKS